MVLRRVAPLAYSQHQGETLAKFFLGGWGWNHHLVFTILFSSVVDTNTNTPAFVLRWARLVFFSEFNPLPNFIIFSASFALGRDSACVPRFVFHGVIPTPQPRSHPSLLTWFVLGGSRLLSKTGRNPCKFFFSGEIFSITNINLPALHLQRTHHISNTLMFLFALNLILFLPLPHLLLLHNHHQPSDDNTKIHMHPSTQTSCHPIYKTAEPSDLDLSF